LIHRARSYLRGRKVLLARTAGEYRAHVDAMPERLGAWLIQEIIPGPESAITLFGGYIARDGKPRQAFTGRKLRQYPSGFGSASLVTSQPCAETLDLTLAFLDRIGFQGICGAEYKRDPRDGRLKIIEINPRPTLWFQATHDAGRRIVEAAWRDMAGMPPLPEPAQRTDVRWRYLLKDLASARFYRRTGDFIFPAPDIGAASGAATRSWPVFDAGDPMPALVEPFGFVRKALERRG
jgi:predicted ATP-grasp superfamily ATP-dependent carboligase